MCSEIYAHFHYELQDASYHPRDAALLSDYRLFGMFHANTCQHNKDVILKSLLVSDGVVRVVFATVALGMGINLQNINTVIHYGAPQVWKITSRRVAKQGEWQSREKWRRCCFHNLLEACQLSSQEATSNSQGP